MGQDRSLQDVLDIVHGHSPGNHDGMLLYLIDHNLLQPTQIFPHISVIHEIPDIIIVSDILKAFCCDLVWCWVSGCISNRCDWNGH